MVKSFLFLDGGLGVHNPGIGRGNIYRRNPEFHFIADSPNGEFETVNLVEQSMHAGGHAGLGSYGSAPRGR